MRSRSPLFLAGLLSAGLASAFAMPAFRIDLERPEPSRRRQAASAGTRRLRTKNVPERCRRAKNAEHHRAKAKRRAKRRAA
jgi:hypothetical protein